MAPMRSQRPSRGGRPGPRLIRSGLRFRIAAAVGVGVAFASATAPSVAAHGTAPNEPPSFANLALGWSFEPAVLLPLLATAIMAARGNIYAGLWYPIVVALVTFVIGALFLRETRDVDIRHF